MNPLPALMTIREVCDYFRVGDDTVRKWISEKHVRAFKHGGIVRIFVDSISAHVERFSK